MTLADLSEIRAAVLAASPRPHSRLHGERHWQAIAYWGERDQKPQMGERIALRFRGRRPYGRRERVLVDCGVYREKQAEEPWE